MARYADPGRVEWVESGGGPLIAVPETVLPFWAGAHGDELAGDYDRACEVESQAGLVPVGDCTALVLGDEPAATAYLPEHGLFVSGRAADSADELLAAVPAALAGAVWGGETRWEVPGPVVLFDAARPGGDATGSDHVRVPLRPGPYAVRAAHAGPGPETRLGLVRLRLLTG